MLFAIGSVFHARRLGVVSLSVSMVVLLPAPVDSTVDFVASHQPPRISRRRRKGPVKFDFVRIDPPVDRTGTPRVLAQLKVRVENEVQVEQWRPVWCCTNSMWRTDDVWQRLSNLGRWR